MERVIAIKRAGAWNVASATDRVRLDSGDRHRRRAVLTGECGTTVMMDWPQPVMLRDGDGLVLDGGTIVQVVGEVEPLLEIGTASAVELIRLAWHLGNRHTDLQIAGDRLRIRHDHVLREMATGLGASVTAIAAPFDPEAGADHTHDHGNGHVG
jgi:urease accessory protein